jgi:hypothetical protein
LFLKATIDRNSSSVSMPASCMPMLQHSAKASFHVA